jgi:hypothetical protein
MLKNRSLLQKIDKYCNGVWKPNKTDEFKFLSNGMLKKITGHNKSMNTGKLSEWYVGEILRKKGINYKCQPIVKYNLNNNLNKTMLKKKIVSKLQSTPLIKLGFKDKITRTTRSSVGHQTRLCSGMYTTGYGSFTGPLTRNKARLLHKKNGTKDTSVPVSPEPEPEQKVQMFDKDLTVRKSTRFIQPDYYLPDHDLFIEVKSRSYNCNGTASEKLDHIVRKYSKLEFTDDYKNSKLLIVCSAYELFEESTSELLNYNNKTSRKYIKDFVQLSKKYNILDWIPIHKINNYL